MYFWKRLAFRCLKTHSDFRHPGEVHFTTLVQIKIFIWDQWSKNKKKERKTQTKTDKNILREERTNKKTGNRTGK